MSHASCSRRVRPRLGCEVGDLQRLATAQRQGIGRVRGDQTLALLDRWGEGVGGDRAFLNPISLLALRDAILPHFWLRIHSS